MKCAKLSFFLIDDCTTEAVRWAELTVGQEAGMDAVSGRPVLFENHGYRRTGRHVIVQIPDMADENEKLMLALSEPGAEVFCFGFACMETESVMEQFSLLVRRPVQGKRGVYDPIYMIGRYMSRAAMSRDIEAKLTRHPKGEDCRVMHPFIDTIVHEWAYWKDIAYGVTLTGVFLSVCGGVCYRNWVLARSM